MLKKFPLIVCVVFIAASCSQQPKEESRMPKQYSIQQLYNNVAVDAASFNDDETKVLVDNNSTGIYNVYELSVADSAMQPLTASAKESFFAISYVPAQSVLYILQTRVAMKTHTFI